MLLKTAPEVGAATLAKGLAGPQETALWMVDCLAGLVTSGLLGNSQTLGRANYGKCCGLRHLR
eukprot:196262-Heterocapsa_arctica.AAC.1